MHSVLGSDFVSYTRHGRDCICIESAVRMTASQCEIKAVQRYSRVR